MACPPSWRPPACVRTAGWCTISPVAEVIRFVQGTRATLVVFSAATDSGAADAVAAAAQVAAADPRPLVLAGRGGGSLQDLTRLARTGRGPEV